MKLYKFFSASVLFAAIALASCNTPPIPGPGPGPDDDDTISVIDSTQIPDIDIPAEAITVAQAREMCSKLDSGVYTDKMYVKGWIKKLGSKNSEGITKHGNATFYMADNMTDKDDFQAFQVYGKNGAKIANENEVAKGDYVVIYGPLTNFNGTYETQGKGAAYIYSSSNPNFGVGGGDDNNNDSIDIEYQDGELSVSQLLEQYGNLAASDTTDYLVVRGVVKKGVTVALNYGTFTGNLTDGKNDVYCYGIAAGPGDGTTFDKFVSAKQIKEGDIVTIRARFYHYEKDAETHTLELIKGYVTRTTNTFDPSTVGGPEEIDVVKALEIAGALAQGAVSDVQYLITGSVTEVTDASTTYGNLTFDMSDESGKSVITVYRVYYVGNVKYTEEIKKATPLEKGDVVTVLGQIKNHYGTPEIVNGNLTAHVK